MEKFIAKSELGNEIPIECADELTAANLFFNTMQFWHFPGAKVTIINSKGKKSKYILGIQKISGLGATFSAYKENK